MTDHADHADRTATASAPQRTVVRLTIDRPPATTASRFLAEHAGLPHARVKDAMAKGATWLRRGRHEDRLRRATAALRRGDVLALYYDAALLALEPPLAELVDDRGGYSVWNKPPGMLSQGTRFGDHCALLRQVERAVAPSRPALLVHRLDREARGLVLIAHERSTAAALGQMLREHTIEKRYRVRVRGAPLPPGLRGLIDAPLDGKPAISAYAVLTHDAARDISDLEVRTTTGRRHQIRRHLADIGHPILGDPRYGTDNHDPAGLALAAVGLRFRCPLTGDTRDYTITPERPPTS